MKPSYTSAFAIGAVVGLILAAAGTLFAGATGGVSKLGVNGEGSVLDPVFNVPASALWFVVILTSAGLGLVLAVATRAVANVIDPDAPSVTLWVIGPLGAIVGGVVAFAVFPLGVSGFGTLQDGVATVSIAEMMLLSAMVGVSAGAVITWQSYIMARPPTAEDDPELLPADTASTSG
jgi:hypothetical protein